MCPSFIQKIKKIKNETDNIYICFYLILYNINYICELIHDDNVATLAPT